MRGMKSADLGHTHSAVGIKNNDGHENAKVHVDAGMNRLQLGMRTARMAIKGRVHVERLYV